MRATHALSQELDLGVLERRRLKLRLDALLLLVVGLDLANLDLLGLQPLDHALLLARQQEQERLALGLVAGCPSNAVDVRLDVLGAIDLYNPVDGREVESASGDVGGEEDRVLGRDEALVDLETLSLLLLAVHVEEGNSRTEMTEVLVDEANLRWKKGSAHEVKAERAVRTCLPLERKTMVLVKR